MSNKIHKKKYIRLIYLITYLNHIYNVCIYVRKSDPHN